MLIPLFIVTFSKFEIVAADTALFFLSMCSFFLGLVIFFSAGWEISKYDLNRVGFPVDFEGVKRANLSKTQPPKLITSGIFSYVRNPAAIGALLIIAAEALFFDSIILGIYAVIVFLFMNVRIIYSEESELHDAFGEEYENYKNHVPRWLPLPVVGKSAPPPTLVHPPALEKKLEQDEAVQKAQEQQKAAEKAAAEAQEAAQKAKLAAQKAADQKAAAIKAEAEKEAAQKAALLAEKVQAAQIQKDLSKMPPVKEIENIKDILPSQKNPDPKAPISTKVSDSSKS